MTITQTTSTPEITAPAARDPKLCCTNCDAPLEVLPGEGDLLSRCSHPRPCIAWTRGMRGCYPARG